eukprot:g1606.t1
MDLLPPNDDMTANPTGASTGSSTEPMESRQVMSKASLRRAQRLQEEKLGLRPKRPKKPHTAYLYFLLEQSPRIRAEHPELGMSQVAKLVGNTWKNVGDRTPWIEKAEQDRLRYEREMETYKASQPAQKRQARNPYWFFCRDRKEEIKRRCPNYNFGQINKELGRLWKALSEEEKVGFRALSDADKRVARAHNLRVEHEEAERKKKMIELLKVGTRRRKRGRKPKDKDDDKKDSKSKGKDDEIDLDDLRKPDMNLPQGVEWLRLLQSQKRKKPKYKRAKTAYHFYTIEKRKEVTEMYPDLKFGQINRKLGEMWKKVKGEERQRFESMAEETKAQAKARMEAQDGADSQMI